MKKHEELDQEIEKEEKADKKVLKEIVKLSQELEETKAKLIEAQSEQEKWKNKYYEAYADLDNTRKNLSRDHEVALKYRAMGFIEKLLPALDSFEMAFKNEPTDEKIKNYLKGFQMIYSQFEKALQEEGVTPIDPAIGEPFDHNQMQAIATAPGQEDDKIVSVYLKGYYLQDRIVRPAMVVVSKVMEEAQDDKKD